MNKLLTFIWEVQLLGYVNNDTTKWKKIKASTQRMKPQLEYMLKQVEEGLTHFRKEIKMKLKE